jgi:undecaprenyl diphosphate synthase
MDGNGRWAQARGLERVDGHREGAQAVRTITRACRRWGIRHLTLYAFSEQNWERPEDEVAALMELLADYVRSERDEIMGNNIRLDAVGALGKLPAPALQGLNALRDESRGNTGMSLCLALSYGGREEIVDAARRACELAQMGELDPDSLTPETFRGFLSRPDIPDPDLVIRTSGEFRVSNFLLWQIAYAEFHITDTLWPEFGEEHLMAALQSFAGRERRFGKTGAQVRS